jgi:hypothetical protein
MWNSNNNTPSVNQSSSIDFSLPNGIPNPKDLLQELRYNMDFCAANRLLQTRKWLGELISGMPPSNFLHHQESLRKANPFLTNGPYQKNAIFYEDQSSEQDQLNLGRALFDLREY